MGVRKYRCSVDVLERSLEEWDVLVPDSISDEGAIEDYCQAKVREGEAEFFVKETKTPDPRDEVLGFKLIGEVHE